MSVYIKGMQPPESCSDCPLLDFESGTIKCTVTGEIFESGEYLWNHRSTRCPTVELPEHGRLIDADALKEYIDMQKGRTFIGCTIGEALKIMTDEQPTIIEADRRPETEAVEECPHCGHENVYPAWDVETQGYVAKCQGCGEDIMLCDECTHADDNLDRRCDWTEEGGCFRHRKGDDGENEKVIKSQ